MKRCRSVLGAFGTAPSLFTALAICICTLFGAPSTAVAQCNSSAGTTTCTDNPASFPNPAVGGAPTGGAAAASGDTTLTVNSLTPGDNITPNSGVAGAGLVIAPGQASGGGGGIVGGGGSNGGSNPAEAINLQGTGITFQVNTTGAVGIDAQSIGQTGGTGGTGVSVLAVGFGGGGGTGGTGGNITVMTTGAGTISTTGTNEHAIEALSEGGAGGQGGQCVGAVGFLCDAGNGNTGGAPGTVTVTNVLNLNTTGTGAAGIWAQSVGAPGGSGGTSSGLCAICLGGSGAAASNGATVNVTTDSVITTQGNNAIGIFAQSVGGYAGSGGGSFGLFSFGGNSSSAGAGGVVTVTDNGGSITTQNPGSTAIFAQSGGGGGGAGGAGGGLVGFGGSGSTGGNALAVSVTNSATLEVEGNLSNGIFAQAFGGGGGTGGVGAGLAGIGGNGGGGGSACNATSLSGGNCAGPYTPSVTVQNSGAVTVEGSGSLNPATGQAIDAAGIYAQSIGGGGGNGGLGAGIVGIGGTGGAAGNGGDVVVDNSSTGTITHTSCTTCIEAPDIFAQSVGGGGGDGGSSGGLVAVGGNASGGGTGGNVTVNNNANLTAYGDLSPGLFAQSVGGGGGNGGFSLGVGVFASVAVGGSGGNGGNGGNVCVNADTTCTNVNPLLTSSRIATDGFRSPGIMAQSVGGGGGNGGNAISASVGIFGSASFGIGGTGGSGGSAGNVFVGADGIITTVGDYSPGIDAESVGGGGGNGGFAISASGGATYASLGIALGGTGGPGNTPGTVTIDSTTNIATQGEFSAAIGAHAIGGGGGQGGFTVAVAGSVGAGLSFGLGGSGGAGANANTVTVTSIGNLTTGAMGESAGVSDMSPGILAESVGGSGGSGGFAVSASGAAYGAVSASVGGNGGNGGDGETVIVNNNCNAPCTSGTQANQIITYGALSDGIQAQSIGGSGGSGGFAVSASGAEFASINLSFGGGGAAGGNGGNVTVNSFGAITTYGDKSDGIFAESVGGGGGSGGFAASAGGALYGALGLSLGGAGSGGGNGQTVTVNNTGAITTNGMNADGIFAQSVGGGGGDGGLALAATGSEYASLALSFGGSGGRGGTGGAVTVNSTGDITTVQDESTGIFAQSLGGSGGNGGLAISGTLTVSTGFSGNLSMAVGGAGGSGATGGNVQVTSIGNISTGSLINGTGMNSDGILAQSIGGSGGNGGISGALNLAGSGGAFTSSVGGVGGMGNGAGTVSVTSIGNITTQLANSTGIFAQSVGGGGGNGGFSLLLAANYDGTTTPSGPTIGGLCNGACAGAGGGGGTGNTVSVTSNGTVYTNGTLADGIIAQSIGGGGGRGGFSVGANLSYGGSTDVNSVGGSGGSGNTAAQVFVQAAATVGSSIPGFSVVTTADNSVGILAQSVGGGGGTGGFSVAVSLSAGGDANGNTVGGNGGTGGNSLNVGTAGNAGYIPAVQVNDIGSISTGGRNASAIEAQSIGGGGGDGGFSIGDAGTVNDDSNSKLQAVGGTGGAAGSAGDVVVMANATANSAASITTVGDLSYGILAQSVGGGGGNGGFAIVGSLSTSGGAEADATGGNGAGGGNAGLVTVTMGGTITTGSASFIGTAFQQSLSGEGSVGILAQSIGGGGGSGGFSGGLALGLSSDSTSNTTGGSGALAGNGSNVSVTTLTGAAITTYGDSAAGILAQSVGGGGGSGGLSVGAAFSNSEGKSATNTTGGQAGAGGNGGGVTVTNAANITTYGYFSDGIIAQSIGGGGGNGGFAVSGSLSLGDDAAANTTGGQGGAGGNGYTILSGSGACGVTATCTSVQVTNTGTIQVFQMGNIGILAQSVGGGGGNGGFAGGVGFSNSSSATTNTVGGQGGGAGNGGEVDVFNYGTVAMSGAHSIGILAQSVGGGGGNGGFSLSAGGATNGSAGATDAIGGVGGMGGTSGVVNVTNEVGGLIMTDGLMSYGILAQSVGGGGGNGGFALSGSYSSSGDDASSSVGGGCTTSCSGGGFGGGGGASNTVTVKNYGMIITEAANSMGIVAQSVGGGGGTGGFAGQLTVNSSSGGAMSSTVGGQGGAGGAGGEVDVTNENTGIIHTLAANSIGILAQSVGGGGGSGGFTITGSASEGGNTAATTVGGGGGGGGNGGVVNVTNNGMIITSGLMSAGIFAQSVGGGGGAGGFAITGSLNVGSGGSNNSVGGGCNSNCGGGGGGGGGNASAVTVINTGTIMVAQAGSIGIVAQSVGGGGGSAGFTGQASYNGGSLNNQVGGTGGNGGNGGNVTVNSTGSIITRGDNSIAVLAQSIGGGGGNGAITLTGSTDGSISGTDLNVGGQNTGGSQGSMGTVMVNVSGGTTTTNGALAYGLLAQAIGAGGGNGALVVPDPLTISGDPTIQDGSNGSVGGSGSAMNTSNANIVMTTGAAAVGQTVQSIGGGGGTDGMAGNVVMSGMPFNAFVGGNNTSGGNLSGSGGSVPYSNTGSVTTTGDNSIGVLVQSIGGGGGLGTYSFGTVTGTGDTVALTTGGSQGAAGNGNTVTMTTFTGDIDTKGLLSEGVVAQSIGGGGGVASFVVSSGGINLAAGGLQLGAGGAGGPGGTANTVTLTSAAPLIMTTNTGAVGIIAQSIGGGGGVTQIYGAALSGGSNTVTLGAVNGAAGSGGTVTVSSAGEISTAGTGAHGILAQSIGGGGGFVQAFDGSGNPLNLSAVGGVGGGGGAGGAVGVNSSGLIITTGAGADGIIAQSIGGGGGLIGDGAFALSLPATGPFAGTAGGSGAGGTVGVTASANISTTGLNSTAIFAESLGGSGGNAITVNVNSGVLITGGYFTGNPIPVAGNAIALVGGLNNTITNAGTLATVSGINGMTITAGIGSNAVVNTDYVIGSVNLCLNGGCGPVNSFDNRSSGGLVYDTVCGANGGTNCVFPGAIFDSGSTVYLGPASVAGNVLSNEGLMSPGGYLNVATTNVTGNFTQSSTGTYGLDLNFLNQTSDLINITGTASVSGTVAVNINNPSLALPGTYQTTIVAAAGDVTSHAGLTLDALATAVAQYSLVYPNANDIDLQYSINFSPSGLTTNEHSVGNAVNAIQTARSSPNFAPIAAALFYQPTIAALGQVYDSLSGEGVSGAEQTAFAANQLFMNSISQQTQIWLGNAPSNPNSIVMYADDALGYAGVDPENPISKALAARAIHAWRFWSEPYGGGGSVSGELPLGTAQLGYSGGGLAVGTDYQVDPDTILGLAVGGNLSSFDVSSRATTGTVQGGQLSAYAAKRWGPLYATGIAGFGVFSNTEQRFAGLPGSTAPIIPVPGFAEQLSGSFASQSFNARFEAGWRATYDDFNVTPFGAVEYGLLHSDQFAEIQSNGPDLLGLAYASHFVDSVPTFLGVQFDSMKPDSPSRLTYWTRLSWMHEFEPYRTIDPSFLAAPGFDFTVNGAVAPRDAAAVDLGLKYALTPHLNALASFNGLFAPEGISYAGTAGLQSQW